MFDFLEIADALDLHKESLIRYGGATGLREPGLLDSALASALNTFLYASGDVFDVAAAYAFHLLESQFFLTETNAPGSAQRFCF